MIVVIFLGKIISFKVLSSSGESSSNESSSNESSSNESSSNESSSGESSSNALVSILSKSVHCEKSAISIFFFPIIDSILVTVAGTINLLSTTNLSTLCLPIVVTVTLVKSSKAFAILSKTFPLTSFLLSSISLLYF